MKTMKAPFNRVDNILSSITFGELIDTVTANEKVIDEEAILRTYENILESNLKDARFLVKKHLESIRKECE